MTTGGSCTIHPKAIYRQTLGAGDAIADVLLTELVVPFLDGFVGHEHPAHKEESFDVAVARAEAVIQPMISAGSRWCL
jgi:hypothetical protein